MTMRRVHTLLVTLALGAFLGACSKNRLTVGEAARPTPEPPALSETPVERDPNAIVDFLEYSVRRPLSHVFIPPRALRSWLDSKVEAYNPTAEDDVVNSSWFTHRNGKQRMTPDEVARGPGDGTGPDTSGTWTVFRANKEGVTPGFMIRDAAGVGYLVKFDPPDHAELASSAEVITSRLFHASGYFVPECAVTYIDPSNVRAAEGLTFEDPLGRKSPVGDDFIQELLQAVPRRADGRIRAVASKLLSGTLGPFDYEGTRDDDPADTIPHEHRRELRGLYVLAAWLNHLDTKQHNSLDILVDEDGQQRVVHYLIDFGSTLGSAALRPNAPRDGVEYDFDLAAIGARWVTAGFYSESWERYRQPPIHPAVGFYAADLFDPGNWKSNYPNPAFQNRTVRDGYWGAKLVASFDEEQIRAAVTAGRLSDPAAADALTRAIIARRDLTVAYWYLRVTPLEEPSIEGSANGPVLSFRDLAVSEGVVPAAGRRYEMRFDFPAARIRAEGVREPQISAAGEGRLELPAPPSDPAFWQELRNRPVAKQLAVLELRAIAADNAPRPRSVRIYLLPLEEAGYRIVGRAY